MTEENIEELHVSESPLEAKRRKNKEAKRAQRARDKSAKAAESETLMQAWQRHSEKLKQNDPALYERFFQRHQDLDDLETEISDCEDGRTEAIRHIAECWLDARKEIEDHGEINYGAIDRRPDFRPTGLTYDVNEPYRYFGFHTRLSADSFYKITRAFVKYALETKDATLDPAIVDAAVNEFTSREFASREINPPLISLIRVYRGLTANEPPAWEFLRASDGFAQLVPRSIAESYRNKGIIFRSPAQLARLEEGRRNME